MFITGDKKLTPNEVAQAIERHRDRLAAILGKSIDQQQPPLHQEMETIDAKDPANWDRMSDWLHEQADYYVAALRDAVEGTR